MNLHFRSDKFVIDKPTYDVVVVFNKSSNRASSFDILFRKSQGKSGNLSDKRGLLSLGNCTHCQ